MISTSNYLTISNGLPAVDRTLLTPLTAAHDRRLRGMTMHKNAEKPESAVERDPLAAIREAGLNDPAELKRVGHELIKIADALASLDQCVRPTANDDTMTMDQRLSDLAASMFRARRRRANQLPKELLGEPAWDILLDLFVNFVRGQRVGVSSACIAADIPTSTALRWIGVLVSKGLVERRDQQHDLRVTEVRLTKSGYRSMRSLLLDCISISGG